MAIIDDAVYATQPKPLRNQIEKLLREAPSHDIDGEILALIVPDSNRLRSASIAAEVYKCLKGRDYDTIILIGPSHSGTFRRLTICSVDSYWTPLGEIDVNDRIRNELCDEDDDIFLDDTGHFHTEGIDVQLPFLQTVLDEFDIVPIVMGEESPDLCRELGYAVGEVMYNARTLVIAAADILESTDETMARFVEHFENADISRLMSLLNSEEVRVEGRGAVLVAMIAALHRRANKAQILSTVDPEGAKVGGIGAVLWRG